MEIRLQGCPHGSHRRPGGRILARGRLSQACRLESLAVSGHQRSANSPRGCRSGRTHSIGPRRRCRRDARHKEPRFTPGRHLRSDGRGSSHHTREGRRRNRRLHRGRLLVQGGRRAPVELARLRRTPRGNPQRSHLGGCRLEQRRPNLPARPRERLQQRVHRPNPQWRSFLRRS